MKAIFLILTSLIIVSISCKKNDTADTFPSETQEGRNTFGAYLDASQFIAGTTLFGQVRPINVSYHRDSTFLYKAGFLSIGATDARYSIFSVAGQIAINKQNIFRIGEYSLVDVAGHSGNFNVDGISYYNAKSGKVYLAESGKLTITRLDTINKIVSGRFNFTAKDSLGAKVQITDGRFDAKYLN